MCFKKILSLMIIICMAVAMTSCGTLDVMKDLKSAKGPADAEDDLSDFAIIDDGVTDAADPDAIETITVNTTNEKMKEIVAYYEDDNGFVVPVKTSIPWEEGIAKATLKCLVKGSPTEQRIAQSGLHGVLPEGTEIKGMSIQDGLCRVDLSSNVLNTQSYDQEKNMVTAVAYTLTEFDTVDRVELMVDGKEMMSLPQGYPVDTAIERRNINLYGDENGVNYTVYYKTPDTEVAGYYVPVTFTATKAENPAAAVVAKLFDGPPTDLPVSNNIPYGVNFEGLQLNGDQAVVDLGIGAVNLSQEEFEDMNQIVVLCLNQFGNISDVDYQIEGMSFEEAGLSFQDNEVTAVFNEY